MLIGVRIENGTDLDRILNRTAEILVARGLRVAGHIQSRGKARAGCACREMHLRDLASGRMHLISEARGPEARGCHLDWDALLSLAQDLEASLDEETNVLIVNRFGRSESEGKGLRGVIERAMELEIPVIVGVRGEYRDAWEAFHGGLATETGADAQAIIAHIDADAASRAATAAE